jgi:TubC N-terminal docking domain
MSPGVEILSELASRGVTVRVVGDMLKLKPADALDSALLERVRVHKPEILAALRAKDPSMPTAPCRACGSRLFWRSIHNVLICFRCHPGSEALIRDLIWLERRAGAWTAEIKWTQ